MIYKWNYQRGGEQNIIEIVFYIVMFIYLSFTNFQVNIIGLVFLLSHVLCVSIVQLITL